MATTAGWGDRHPRARARRPARGDCAQSACKLALQAGTDACTPQGHQLAFDGLPCRVAGLVPKDDFQAASEQHLRGHEAVRNARFMNLALIAAAEALQVLQPRSSQSSSSLCDSLQAGPE